MHKFFGKISQLIADSVESVELKNIDEKPQIILKPKGVLKDILEIIGKKNGRQEEKKDS